MAFVRDFSRFVVISCLFACVPAVCYAQYAEQNVNMVSGTGWPGGDPYLQRQNEPSVAASTRNALRLVAGANDYRTVDLPGLPDGEETGDAWLGLFKSFDGGLTWRSTLIPGYPQDASIEGLASPLRQKVNGIDFPAAADPMVRSGLNGMFYYSGLAVTRTSPPVGAVFVARLNDFNNREGSDPIQYLGMSIVADGRPGLKFYDKPSLAVDVPRFGASLCSVGGQTFFGGNVYVVYTAIDSHISNGATVTDAAKLWFSRSTDCGATWSASSLISGTNTVNQGSVITIDTWTGNVYVVWRRFAKDLQADAIVAAKSTDGGKNFSAPVVVHTISPFEQNTTGASFRTNAYPTAVTDANGHVYVAWSERSGPSGNLANISNKNDGRIMLSTSSDGVSWSSPVMAAPTAPIYPLSGRGHQFMPALSYASGKVMLVYYDLREDSTIGHYTPAPIFSETRALVGDLAGASNLDNVFNNYVQDASVVPMTSLKRRHTLDLRASQANPGALPVFEDSKRVSRYRFGSTPANPDIRQLEFNPPNLKMFKSGTVPFFGDYIDLVPQYPFISALLNLPIPAPVFHAVWTDNRDVRPPVDGDWVHYTPPNSLANNHISKINGQPLDPCVADHVAMRNQNIYTARITSGIFFASPGNDKPLGLIQRAFVVSVQNGKAAAQSYRLQIVNQPPGGKATFQQLPANAAALTTLDVTINAKSTGSRTVFVTSTMKNAPVGVTVTEISGPGGTPIARALTSAAVLNPDPSSPDIGNPGTGTPDIGNTEVYNPDIGNPDIGNPDIGNPDIGNPDIGNPDIGNPDIGNGSVTDTTWAVTNDGNTTSSYSAKLYQFGNIPNPNDVRLQLILHQTYRTPVATDCNLRTQRHQILLANVPHPTLLTSITNIGAPDIGNPTVPTVAIAPGDSVNLTVRVIDTNPLHDPARKGATIPATSFLTPVLVAHAINTVDLNNPNNPNPQPAISMVITTPSLPDGVRNVSYSGPAMTALFGVGPLTWSAVPPPIEGSALPYGLQMDPATGVISGTPLSTGTYTITISVHDSATPTPHSTVRAYTIHIVDPLSFVQTSVPAAVQSSPYSVALVSSGGRTPIHWSLAPDTGILPAGLTLSDGGTISGTPTTVGSSTFKVRLSDSSQPTTQVVVSPVVRIDVLNPLVITTTSLPNAVQGFSYTTTLSSTGGSGPIHWSIASGSLPDDMSLSDGGTISGICPFTETPLVTFRATDSSNPPHVTTSPQMPLYVYSAICSGETFQLYDNSNIGEVLNGGQSPTFSTDGRTVCLVRLVTYHWNGSAGQTPGSIGLVFNNRSVGNWAATGTAGQPPNTQNANWTAVPDPQVIVLNGAYKVIDSDPATWSQNAASNGFGFVQVYVRPASRPSF